ncbi:MAG TPA: DUF4965 domain-containing protein [Armatimonadota bacterium]|jgi:hypothetical protein
MHRTIVAAFLAATAAQAAPIRPPAVPLVTHDPYFSVWSMGNNLAESWPKHWTGTAFGACGLVRVDGVTYRFMGTAPEAPTAAKQTALSVSATQTRYTFAAGPVNLGVRFTSPVLADDLDLASRPATYVTFTARSRDSKSHDVQVYLDASAEWAVNDADQTVEWKRLDADGLNVMSVGTADQPVLRRAGDGTRIDWGHFLLAVPKSAAGATAIASDAVARHGWATSGRLPETDDARQPRAANDAWPVLAASLDFGSVDRFAHTRHVILAYDDVSSIEYFNKPLPAWWRRAPGTTGLTMLGDAERQYADLLRKCDNFDTDLTARARKAGGDDYAELCTLAYRQCLAAHKIVAGPDGKPLMFPKENSSNGCIATVDVFYPSAPFFLALNNEMMKAQLRPILDYASSARWKFPFAPHDIGTYPKANGQVYGGGERTEENQMPVEESGNMLILMLAVARKDGSASFAEPYWPTLRKWAGYLREKGMDPENQLCTDDFAGHLAHNTNLSLKAILAIGAYSRLREMAGAKAEADEYLKVARDMAAKWPAMADDGDHYRLAFDQPNTWSQKYNLVWDRILGLDLFPASVARKEVAFYKKHLNDYGLPLDSRRDYTKADWQIWTACLAESPEDFRALSSPILDFLNDTPDRVPFSDWYDTKTSKHVGFIARSVVGGVYMKLLMPAK